MGYRHYFYLTDKEEVEKVKDKTYKELIEIGKQEGFYEAWEDEEYINFHSDNFLNKREIYEFGKLYYEDTAERIYSKGVPLFTLEDTQEYFKDYAPYVMGAEGLLEAIDIYKNKIISYYRDLLKDGAEQILPFGFTVKRDDIKSVDKMASEIQDKLFYWMQNLAINLDAENEKITSAWLYEYGIFELVRLYKAIDWNKKCLLFFGY